MSFASYQRLPTMLTYATALNKAKTTEPIRGRSPELIPLGARRDCDKFAIRLEESGDVCVLLYNHPWLKYLKPTADQPEHITRIQLLNSRYGWGVSEGWTLDSLFHGVLHAQVSRKYVKIFRAAGDPFVIPMPTAATPVTLEVDAQKRTVERVEEVVLSAWRINRAEANNVRKQYGKFYRFMKGMIGVRKQEYRPWSPHYAAADLVVEFNASEFADVAEAHPILFSKSWGDSLDKNPMLNSDKYHAWVEKMTHFITLIEDNPDEAVQWQNFAHAFAVLGYLCAATNRVRSSDKVKVEDIPKKADELLFKHYSNKVFQRAPVPEGSVPRTTYDLWVDRATI